MFPRPEQSLRQPDVKQTGGDLVANRLEQIEILHGERGSTHLVTQDDQGEQFTAGDDGHADPGSTLVELVRVAAA